MVPLLLMGATYNEGVGAESDNPVALHDFVNNLGIGGNANDNRNIFNEYWKKCMEVFIKVISEVSEKLVNSVDSIIAENFESLDAEKKAEARKVYEIERQKK